MVSLVTGGKRRSIRAHRLALYMRGINIPTGMEVDHIDGNKLNNKLENLRIVSRVENNRNTKTGKNNTSGVKGVHWDKGVGKWRAVIWVNKKCIQLGVFDYLDDARAARESAKIKYGFHSNHG